MQSPKLLEFKILHFCDFFFLFSYAQGSGFTPPNKDEVLIISTKLYTHVWQMAILDCGHLT